MINALGPIVIAVCGSPAAGKTTIARAVADEMPVPLVTRDEIAFGLQLTAAEDVMPDEIRTAAEQAMTEVSHALARSRVSFVLESSVLDESHLRPLLDHDVRVVAVHVVAPPDVIGDRLRQRVDEGMPGAQRLLDQYESGVMRPEIFFPSEVADRLVTIDTSSGLCIEDHCSGIIAVVRELAA